MRAKTVGRWAIVIVLVVLSVMVLPASVALADQADKVSDDGVDYGWLYRRGNMWYDKETDEAVLAEDEYGIFYTYSAENARSNKNFGAPNNYSKHLDFLSHSDRWAMGNYANAVRLQRTYYEDGTLFYSAWGREYLDAVVASGRIDRISSQNYQNTSDCLSRSRSERSRVNSNERVQKGKRSEIRRVVIDPSAFDTQYFSDNLLNLYIADEETREYIRNLNYLPARYTESWFNGCVNLREIVGLENIRTDSIVNMARMFAGCPQLESLDLSTFDTSACANFAEMFDGCESLCELRTGDGWTQEHVGEKVHNEQSYNSRYPPPEPEYARFPVDMVRQEDGEQFAAGDVVPDGAGTYVVVGRERLDPSWLTLEAPEGASHVGGDEPLTLEYTGEALEPACSLVTGDGAQLVEGEDFWVEYERNDGVGVARAVVHGTGAYYGYASAEFRIEDTSAWAFLYADGTLVLKKGHELPDYTLVDASRDVSESMRWFDAYEARPGATVPWAGVAADVRRVIIDGSFASLSPVTMEGWFAGFTALTGVEGLGNVNDSAVESAARLFEGCSSLAELDLSGLTLAATKDLSALACGCTGLERLDLADVDARGAADTSRFFEGCTSLAEVRTGAGWRNASDARARLSLGRAGFRTEPSYKRVAAADALGDGLALYRVADLPVQFADVEVAGQTYVCTGRPVTPKVTVRLGGVALKEGTDYSLAYKNNRYPGKATITVSGKGVMSGVVDAPFTLRAGVTKGQKVTYRTKNVTFTFKVTKVGKDGVTADASVVKVNVRNPRIQSVTIPSTCTIGKVKITITTVSKKIVGRFANVSQVVIGPKVTRIGAWAFYNAPSVERLVIKSKRLKSVRDCLAGSNVWEVWTKASLSKSKRKKYKRWFTYYSGQDWVWYHYR